MEGAVSLPLLGDVIRVVLSPKNVPPSASILLPRGLKAMSPTNSKSHSRSMDKELTSSPSKLPGVPKRNVNLSADGYQLVEKHATHSAGGCFQEVFH